MDAQTAYNESLYRGEANNILENIVAGIEKECEIGNFEYEGHIDNKTSNEIFNLVCSDLRENGYKVDVNKEFGGIVITVSWRCGRRN